MRNDIFARIVESVPMVAVAERYGFNVNRSGDMLCPFHSDSHPSLHVYPDSRGWWCFVCNEGGDVIDFVKRLYHINARQAAMRLDNDFCLGLTVGLQSPHEVSQEIQRRKREHDAIASAQAVFSTKCREAETIRSLPKPPPESDLWAEYAALLARLDYLDNYWFSVHKYPERYADLQEAR